MHRTRVDGLRVGWRQGLYEKDGVGTLLIDVLGEKEYELTPVPRVYLKQLRSSSDAVRLMNDLLVMYGFGPQ